MKRTRNNISTQGYVKIPRSVLNKGWIRDVSVARTYLALMLLANYESTTVCKRGTVGFSLTEIAGLLGMNTRTIKADCKALGFEVKTTNRGTQIVIPEYDETQGIFKKPSKDTSKNTSESADTKEIINNDSDEEEVIFFNWDDEEGN